MSESEREKHISSHHEAEKEDEDVEVEHVEVEHEDDPSLKATRRATTAMN